MERPTGTLIERHRLDSLLDLVFESEAGEVTGPAGSGKTTALRSWASRTPVGDVALLTARAEHRDPDVLCRDVAHLASYGLTGRRSLDDARNPSVDAIVDAVARSGRRRVVVVDEAECLVGSEAAAVLRELIGRGGDSLRIVVSGRELPQIGLDESRRRGSLVAVGERDLRLTPDETAEIICSISGVEVDDRTAAAVHHELGGWALGATLAGLVLRSTDVATTDAVSGIGHHRYFDQYFGAEVFAALPTALQAFLLDTSVLDELDPDLCRHVSGRGDAEAVLWDLEGSNVFTTWTGGSPPAFRYHQLLRSWLLGRLRSADPTRAAELRGRAARWCAANDRPAAAVEYWIAAGETTVAADAVVAYGPAALSEGRYEALSRWIGALPKPLVASSGPLLMLLAEAAYRSGDAVSTSSVRALEDGLLARDDQTGPGLMVSVIVQRSRELHTAGRLAAAATEARRAIGLVEMETPPTTEVGFDQVALATQASSIVSQLMFDGDWAATSRLARRLVDTCPADAVTTAPARVSCLGKLAVIELLRNARPAAADLAHEAISLCRFHGIDPIDIGFAEMVLLVASPDADTAALHANLVRRSEQMALPAHTALAWLLRAWSYVGEGQLEAAQATFDEAARIVSEFDEPGMLAAVTRRVGAIVAIGADGPVLSDREHQVLAVLAAGRSRRQAASALNLSLNTVKWYARNAYRALGATTLEEAIDRCAALGITLDARRRDTDAAGAETSD